MIIKINGEILTHVQKGLTIAERKDEELDTGLIICINSRKQEYDPYSRVEIYITDTGTPDYVYIVEQDESILIKKDSPKKYQHTIALVEPTKILERIVVDNLSFTQPIDSETIRYTLKDVVSRIRNVTPLAETTAWATTRLFNFEGALLTELDEIPAPQFFPKGMNLMQILVEIFKYISAFPRIKDFYEDIPVITKDNLNEISESIIEPKHINTGNSNNSEYFIGKLDITLENAITDRKQTFPPEPHLTILTTPNYVMSTEELQIKTPTPIDAISKVIMVIKYKNASSEQDTTFEHKEVDITHLVYEESAYNIQDLATKQKGLVYKRGEYVIKNFGVSFPTLFGLFMTNNFETILNSSTPISYKPYDSSTPISYKLDDTNQASREYSTPYGLGGDALRGYYGFRIYYYPFFSGRINVIKQLSTTQKEYTSQTNQAAPALSVERVGDNIQGTIDRLGNSDLMYETLFTDWSKRIKVGQQLPNGYIVTSVEYQVQEGIYRAKAVLNKNFNRISQFIGVDREFRQFAIPFDQAVERNLIYNAYITIDNTAAGQASTVFDTTIIEWLRKKFTWEEYLATDGYMYYTLDGAIVSPKMYGETYPIGNFILSVTKSSYKNSNIFYFKFENNTVAYQYPSSAIEKKTALGLDKLITTLTNRRYTYHNSDDPNDLKNGTFWSMSVTLGAFTYGYMQDSLDLRAHHIKDAYEFVIQKNTLVAAQAHYDSFYSPSGDPEYPRGLFYQLTSEMFEDDTGNSYEFVLISDFWLTEFKKQQKVIGFREHNVIRELLYNMSYHTTATWLGRPSMTNHPAFIEARYPDIRFQEVYTNAEEDNIASFFKHDYRKIKLDDLMVIKDPSEIISMTFQIHYLPGESDTVIGSQLSMTSPYIKKPIQLASNEQLLAIYLHTGYYSQHDDKVKGTKHSTSFTGITATATTAGFSIEIPSGLVVGYNSWAIGNDDGYLIFAVNRDPLTNIISVKKFFNFRNKL